MVLPIPFGSHSMLQVAYEIGMMIELVQDIIVLMNIVHSIMLMKMND